MMRRDDWLPRLVAYLDGCRTQAYAPGEFDCALFAAGAVEVMTGMDYAAGWRGRYTTLRGGLRVLRNSGHEDHLALAADLFPAVSAAMAGTGDLAVVPGTEGPALGVVVGPAVHCLHPDQGITVISILQATGAFRV